MRQLQVMKVVFDADLAPHETPAFRGAVIHKVGLENDYYHNHDNAAGSPKNYHYRYPLIQYRQDRKRPAMVFIGQGIPEAQHLFTRPDWSLTFSGRTHHLNIADLQLRQAPFGITDTYRYYTLHRWQALNEHNIKLYTATEDPEARRARLQKILSGHIISFAKGIDYRIEARFDAQITDILRSRIYLYEGIKALTFDVRIRTNLVFPPFVALGKGVSLGFGEVRAWKVCQ